MKSKLLLIAFIGLAGSAQADDNKADPRAFEACKAQSSSFVQVSECLPEAHVAVKVLDAFDSSYPEAAKPLKIKCLELNAKNISGAATCVEAAIASAIKLKRAMPSNATLGDPIFDAVSDPALQENLDAAGKRAQADFPDKQIWGGSIYHPYK